MRCEGPQRLKSSLSEAIDQSQSLFFFAGSLPKYKENNKKGQVKSLRSIGTKIQKKH